MMRQRLSLIAAILLWIATNLSAATVGASASVINGGGTGAKKSSKALPTRGILELECGNAYCSFEQAAGSRTQQEDQQSGVGAGEWAAVCRKLGLSAETTSLLFYACDASRKDSFLDEQEYSRAWVVASFVALVTRFFSWLVAELVTFSQRALVVTLLAVAIVFACVVLPLFWTILLAAVPTIAFKEGFLSFVYYDARATSVFSDVSTSLGDGGANKDTDASGAVMEEMESIERWQRRSGQVLTYIVFCNVTLYLLFFYVSCLFILNYSEQTAFSYAAAALAFAFLVPLLLNRQRDYLAPLTIFGLSFFAMRKYALDHSKSLAESSLSCLEWFYHASSSSSSSPTSPSSSSLPPKADLGVVVPIKIQQYMFTFVSLLAVVFVFYFVARVVSFVRSKSERIHDVFSFLLTCYHEGHCFSCLDAIHLIMYQTIVAVAVERLWPAFCDFAFVFDPLEASTELELIYYSPLLLVILCISLYRLQIYRSMTAFLVDAQQVPSQLLFSLVIGQKEVVLRWVCQPACMLFVSNVLHLAKFASKKSSHCRAAEKWMFSKIFRHVLAAASAWNSFSIVAQVTSPISAFMQTQTPVWVGALYLFEILALVHELRSVFFKRSGNIPLHVCSAFLVRTSLHTHGLVGAVIARVFVDATICFVPFISSMLLSVAALPVTLLDALVSVERFDGVVLSGVQEVRSRHGGIKSIESLPDAFSIALDPCLVQVAFLPAGFRPSLGVAKFCQRVDFLRNALIAQQLHVEAQEARRWSIFGHFLSQRAPSCLVLCNPFPSRVDENGSEVVDRGAYLMETRRWGGGPKNGKASSSRLGTFKARDFDDSMCLIVCPENISKRLLDLVSFKTHVLMTISLLVRERLTSMLWIVGNLGTKGTTGSNS